MDRFFNYSNARVNKLVLWLINMEVKSIQILCMISSINILNKVGIFQVNKDVLHLNTHLDQFLQNFLYKNNKNRIGK